MFKTILVATDLTSDSKTALQMAVALATANEASVIAVHVVGLPPTLRRWAAPDFPVDLVSYRELLARQIAAATRALARQVRAAGPGLRDAQCVVKPGDAADVVARLADERQADLIVVARGRGGQLGSTAERIVRMAGRTVLVTPVTPPRGLRVGAPLSRPARRTRRRAAAGR